MIKNRNLIDSVSDQWGGDQSTPFSVFEKYSCAEERLSKKVEPNFDYLSGEMNISNRRALIKRLLKKVESVNLEKLAVEVRPFLLRPDDLVLVSHLNELIKSYAEIPL